MRDVRERLQKLDQLDPPDLWQRSTQMHAPIGDVPAADRRDRWVTIVVAFAVFLASAGLLVRALEGASSGPATTSETPTTSPVPTGSALSVYVNPMGVPIAMRYPSEWFAQSVSQSASDPGTAGTDQVGVVIANAREAMPSPDAATPSPGPLPSNPELPPTSVEVTVLSNTGEASVAADSPLPLSLDDAQVPPGPGNIHTLSATVAGRDLTITVIAGPEASESDLAGASKVVSSIFPSSWETYRDDADRFSIDVPPGWQVSDQPINTWISSPAEILAMATYPLRPGGHAVIDAQVPSNAIDDLGPNDAFIWVSEGVPGSGFPRPDRFSPAAACKEPPFDQPGCIVGLAQNIPNIRAWWFYFDDHGRGIYVFVGMGEGAFNDPKMSQEPWSVLGSLELDR